MNLGQRRFCALWLAPLAGLLVTASPLLAQTLPLPEHLTDLN